MADTNWIKLNRKIWDNFVWSFDKPQYTLAWIDMLLMTNYKDKQILFNGRMLTIKRGSFVTSIVSLSKRWDMNRRTVKRFLDVLKSNGMITYECTTECTTVFITNYATYQGFFDENEVQNEHCDHEKRHTADGDAQPNAQPNAHNIRNKESKEGKEIKEIREDTTADEPPAAPSSRIPYESIRLLYNEICVSFPRCQTLSEARKKAIKARFTSGKTYEDFQTLFAKAEASSFLKGKNDRNWQANFDWLIKDANMAKVMDGNYDDNKGAHTNGSTGVNPEPRKRYGTYL